MHTTILNSMLVLSLALLRQAALSSYRDQVIEFKPLRAAPGDTLVTTYRETFAATVRESGVDGLIKSLAEKNRERGAGLRLSELIFG